MHFRHWQGRCRGLVALLERLMNQMRPTHTSATNEAWWSFDGESKTPMASKRPVQGSPSEQIFNKRRRGLAGGRLG